MTEKAQKSKAKPASAVLVVAAAVVVYLVNQFTGKPGTAADTAQPPAASTPAAKREPPPKSIDKRDPAPTKDVPSKDVPATDGGAQRVADAFRRRLSGIQVEVKGKVRAVLADDNEGSRHQKFILELSDARTLLVSHNIDLAPRVEGIARGDQVEVYGQYEWSEQGGVLHWTHHDPAKRHADGWIKRNGRTYQ